MASAPKLSVVIPVYNEEQVLPRLFERLYPALDALGRRYEIVFVNDGSRDRHCGPAARTYAPTSLPISSGGFCRSASIVTTYSPRA